jgi:hypothetical protein
MREKELWTPEMKLSYLPDFPRELFIQEGKILYNDFLNNPHRITTRPAPIQTHSNHKIRVVESSNPDWYSQLYYSYTRGKRQRFEKALLRIVNCLDQDLRKSDNHYTYDTAFRNLIYRRLTDGYQMKEGDKTYRVFPDNAVRAFFNLEKIEIPDEEVEMRENYERQFQDKIPF